MTSPGRDLPWDIFLQVLGIFFTVVILRQYFENREKRRWEPARRYMYRQLNRDADWMLSLAPPDIQEKQPKGGYLFGTRGPIDHEQERDFGRRLTQMRPARLAAATEDFANDTYHLERFKRSLDAKLGYAGAVFLAQEPVLNRILSELQGWMDGFEVELKFYRDARESVVPGAGSMPFDQACFRLKQMILTGNWLRRWLLAQATEIEPSSPGSANERNPDTG